MSELLWPRVKEEWKKLPEVQMAETSLMTSVGLVSGAVLLHLEEWGLATLHELLESVEGSVETMLMAIGALLREGLIEAYGSGRSLVITTARRR